MARQTPIVLTGDFTCPWSYLAAHRAALLAGAGVTVDFHAVEHDPWQPRRFMDSSLRFHRLQLEVERVGVMLLPGEELSISLAGFVPRTRAAVSGYAEAHAAGVGPAARRVLLEAFWGNGVDIGDPRLVRTLLVDVVRTGSSPSEALAEWGYAVDVTGGPITTTGWYLVQGWQASWASGKETVPVLNVGDDEPRYGEAAVEWLGEALLRHEVDLTVGPPRPAAPRGDRPGLSWATQHGGRWLRAHQAGYASA